MNSVLLGLRPQAASGNVCSSKNDPAAGPIIPAGLETWAAPWYNQAMLRSPSRLLLALAVACLATAAVLLRDDPRQLWLLRNTLLLAAGSCAISLPLGTALAFLLWRTDVPGRRLAVSLRRRPVAHAPVSASGSLGRGLGAVGLVLPGLRAVLGAAGCRAGTAAIWVHSLAAVPWVVLLVGAAAAGRRTGTGGGCAVGRFHVASLRPRQLAASAGRRGGRRRLGSAGDCHGDDGDGSVPRADVCRRAVHRLCLGRQPRRRMADGRAGDSGRIGTGPGRHRRSSAGGSDLANAAASCPELSVEESTRASRRCRAVVLPADRRNPAGQSRGQSGPGRAASRRCPRAAVVRGAVHPRRRVQPFEFSAGTVLDSFDRSLGGHVRRDRAAPGLAWWRGAAVGGRHRRWSSRPSAWPFPAR